MLIPIPKFGIGIEIPDFGDENSGLGNGCGVEFEKFVIGNRD